MTLHAHSDEQAQGKVGGFRTTGDRGGGESVSPTSSMPKRWPCVWCGVLSGAESESVCSVAVPSSGLRVQISA
eukprot:588734-Rhodomonas_salina.1